jgi:hypothetical protein
MIDVLDQQVNFSSLPAAHAFRFALLVPVAARQVHLIVS